MKFLPIRAAAVVAAVYGYFLIFAQFSFVEIVRVGGIDFAGERWVLGLMAAAGIASGFVAAWRGAAPWMVRGALTLAVMSAAAATFAHGMAAFLIIAATTGVALGVATVSLAALLPAWCGVGWIGLGTGMGYAICNVPAIFLQSPIGQAWTGVGFAMVGLVAVPSVTEWKVRVTPRILPVWGAVALFTALVWMDSAAFFIIQHSEDLKAGTWGGSLLWRNSLMHLGFALLAGIGLACGGARALPALAWVLLAVAALAVNQASSRGLAGWFYPAGVSLYSAALVAWPGWFSGANGARTAAWRAAWLFAIAGWFGSANGIGMAQTLSTVPPLFVAAAGMVVIGVMVFSDLSKWRVVFVVGVVVVTYLISSQPRAIGEASTFERGRQVYLAEGCIHCHSQYVRPGSIDEELWGPVKNLDEVLHGAPVMIGNRRQGPDLTHVGARRSETWLKLHFMDPRLLVPGSVMPSYAHLFDSGKGDDLVRYLKESGVSRMASVVERSSKWVPAGLAGRGDGKALFLRHCAACHGTTGGGQGPLSLEFARGPTNLKEGPFAWTPAGEDLDLRIARVIKFGIPGSDMPGHEVLRDEDVLDLKDHVLSLRGKK
jgi:cbb3-type cytochrome oxidase cytochrome c subunit